MSLGQYWKDERLCFDLKPESINELMIGSDILHHIW